MTASAAIVAEHRGDGTVCTALRSAPPLTLRATADAVYLVGSMAGPLGGDDLRLDVRLGAGADVTVRSAAATVVLPGPGPSRLSITATVQTGATLTWDPEPLVLAAGADHRGTIRITLAPGAGLDCTEVVVLGREHEPAGSVRSRLRVDLGDRPLLRSDLVLGAAWPEWVSPAVLGGSRVVGQRLLVGTDLPSEGAVDMDGLRMAVTRLAGPAVLVTAVGDRVEPVRRTLREAAGG